MPLMKLCSHCGTVIPIGQAMCQSCKDKRTDNSKAYDKHIRDRRSIKFYSSTEWKNARDYALHRDGYACQICKRNGKINAATEVHHIVPLKMDWSKRISPDNLISLCHACHMDIEKKTERHGGIKKV